MIGRDKSIKKVMSNLKRRQYTLVVGPSGIGKTALLTHINTELGPRAYYIEGLSRALLMEAYVTISGPTDEDIKKRKVTQWTVLKLAKALISLQEDRDDFVLIMSSLDRITAASSQWLTELAESNITLLAACCGPKKTDALNRFFWTFETLELKPMSDAEIKSIIRDQVYPPGQSEPAITFRDNKAQRYFVERTIKIAKGVPLAAVGMCKRAAGKGMVSTTFVKEHLVDHKAATKWVDASPILLVAACLLFVLRYASRVMHGSDTYVFFSSLSTIAFIVIRSFSRGGSRKQS